LINITSAPVGKRLEGKVAIITGGGSGIGRASSLTFANHGAKVVVADRDSKSGKETVDQIKQAGGEATFHSVDVSNAKEVEALIAATEKEFKRLDIMFNNAGISHADDDNAQTTTEGVWDLTFNINVKGVFLGCKYAIPALLRAGGGSIINTARFDIKSKILLQNFFKLKRWIDSNKKIFFKSFVAILGAATPQLAYTSSKGAVLC
jgi:NAD(P)-dependent dehydrogenase (short-subunit alcohol dehydrogenase family)